MPACPHRTGAGLIRAARTWIPRSATDFNRIPAVHFVPFFPPVPVKFEWGRDRRGFYLVFKINKLKIRVIKLLKCVSGNVVFVLFSSRVVLK